METLDWKTLDIGTDLASHRAEARWVKVSPFKATQLGTDHRAPATHPGQNPDLWKHDCETKFIFLLIQTFQLT